jgi:hypothetical protein
VDFMRKLGGGGQLEVFRAAHLGQRLLDLARSDWRGDRAGQNSVVFSQ